MKLSGFGGEKNQDQQVGLEMVKTEKTGKNNKHLKSLLIVLATIVILGFASLGFFLWQINKISGVSYQSPKSTLSEDTNKNQNQQGQTSPTAKTTNTKSQSSGGQSSTNPNASTGIPGWKTYTHTNPIFSFQYPKDWKESAINDSNIIINDHFYINWSKTDATSIQDYLTKNSISYPSSSTPIVQIGQGLTAMGPYEDSPDNIIFQHTDEYMVVKNGYVYTIKYDTYLRAGVQDPTNPPASQEIYKKMIPTLAIN